MSEKHIQGTYSTSHTLTTIALCMYVYVFTEYSRKEREADTS